MKDKDKLLQAKSRYMREIQKKQQELLDLQDSLKAINTQLDELNDLKQPKLF